MHDEIMYQMACQHALEAGKIRATYYRRGAVVDGWPSRWPSFGGRPRPPRGEIESQTVRSMIRARFSLQNSPADFELMTTLTFRVGHSDPKAALRQFCVEMGYGQVSSEPWGWVMEFQRRGVVHFHLVSTYAHLALAFPGKPHRFDPLHRGRTSRLVLRGSVGKEIAQIWIKAVGDRTSEFRRFQEGGIVEAVAKPELTAVYLSSYLGKAEQKQLPSDHPNLGRWWWLSQGARPKPESEATLFKWPFDRVHHLVFDKSRIFPM